MGIIDLSFFAALQKRSPPDYILYKQIDNNKYIIREVSYEKTERIKSNL